MMHDGPIDGNGIVIMTTMIASARMIEVIVLMSMLATPMMPITTMTKKNKATIMPLPPTPMMLKTTWLRSSNNSAPAIILISWKITCDIYIGIWTAWYISSQYMYQSLSWYLGKYLPFLLSWSIDDIWLRIKGVICQSTWKPLAPLNSRMIQKVEKLLVYCSVWFLVNTCTCICICILYISLTLCVVVLFRSSVPFLATKLPWWAWPVTMAW